MIKGVAQLDELPDGSVIVGLDAQQTTRFKSEGRWVDSKKPIGTTWSLNTYILARRWGVRVAFTPQDVSEAVS